MPAMTYWKATILDPDFNVGYLTILATDHYEAFKYAEALVVEVFGEGYSVSEVILKTEWM